MTATYPTSRRAFIADEAWGGFPAFAGVARALADWQNYTYNADLPISPWDTKVFGAAPIAVNVGCSQPSAHRTADATIPTLSLGTYRMPAPRGPASKVRWWFWTKLGDASSTGTISVLDASGGTVEAISVTYAACGSVLTGAWLTADIAMDPEGTYEVRLSRSAGASVSVDGISSYWLTSTLWTPTAWAPVSQAATVADGPLSSHLLRWLMKSSNLFLERRAPIQCVASYLGEWAGGGGGTMAARERGRYRFVVGARVSSVKVAIQAANGNTGSQNVTVLFGGSTVATLTVTSIYYAWYTATISVTPSDTVTEIDCEIRGIDDTKSVWVSSVSLWETAATFTLPGAETVPVSFAPNDNGAMAGGSAITASGISAFVANLVWIWKNRGLRSLVCDSRLNAPLREDTYLIGGVWVTPTNLPAPGSDVEVQGCRYFAFADAAVGIPRLMAASHAGCGGATQSVCYSWTDEPAYKSPPNTIQRDQSFDANWWTIGAAGAITRSSGALLDRPTMQLHGPGPTSSAAEQEYRTWTVSDGGAEDRVGTRVCGMRIEQAPLNATAGTR